MEYGQPISFLEVLKTGVFCSKGYKNTRPLAKRQQNANIDASGNVCNEIWKNTHYSKKIDKFIVFSTPSPIPGIQAPPMDSHVIALCRIISD